MTLPTDAVAWAVKQYAEDGRNAKIDRLESYYQGHQPLVFSTETFRKAFGAIFDSFAYNRMESVISAHADRLQIDSFSSLSEELATHAQANWDANDMDVRENEATEDSLAYGGGFVIVEAHPTENRPVYWVNDPRLIRLHWDDVIPGKIDMATKLWLDDEKHGHLNVYYEDRIEKFVSGRKISGIDVKSIRWERKADEGIDGSVSLDITDTVPVFHLGNKARTGQYGRSELELLIPLQDALNYTLMTGMVAAEYGAFTQKVLMGVEPEDEKENQMLERFSLGVNKILTLYGDNAKIGEFTPTNVQAYIDLAEFWDTTVSRISRVPVHYLRATGSPQSGESKRLDELPFTTKIIDQQRQLGHGYAEITRYGLRLSGHPNIAPGEVTVNWMDASPMSDEDRWRIAQMKRSLGLPMNRVLQELGYDADDVTAIMAEYELERQQAQRFLDAGQINLGFE